MIYDYNWDFCNFAHLYYSSASSTTRCAGFPPLFIYFYLIAFWSLYFYHLQN